MRNVASAIVLLTSSLLDDEEVEGDLLAPALPAVVARRPFTGALDDLFTLEPSGCGY
jgi:hypothetical protein